MAVFVKSIAFSALEKVGEEDASLIALIEWTDSVKAHKSVYVGSYDEKRHDDFELVARKRMWDWALEMCEPQNISVRCTEAENTDVDISFIGPAGAVDGVIIYPQRKVVITVTHENAGDDYFRPMILRAFREYELSNDQQDFTASNGVRLRFSWPKDTQLPPDEELIGDDYGALITKPDGKQTFMFISVKQGSDAPVFERVSKEPDNHD